ncbi:disabled homolog 2 [Larimichthys crocea]|uniref:disabled homolog 2 n=1 Tax=Larimichthys crocea TaxID=215358 RepID=UPI000F602083|nr:disabled homolog 2 [Larimichthys crocea]
MMDTEERPGSCPATAQTPVRTWLSSSSRGVPGTPSDSASRFLGDGVRYKAKLIGIDPVPDAQGEKMCWDSMMKLKGFEAAARRQGKHKQRVWLKVSSSGLKIMDERTGILLYDHDRTRISSLRKDESDPRALAYVYQHQDTYILYYIKMANLADPVLIDIKEVCQGVDQETPQEAAEAPTQTSSLLLLNDSPAPPAEGPALEDVFSPDSSPGQSNQASSTNELMEIFSIQMEDAMMPTQTCTSHSESPQPTLSSSQILSMFPTQPLRSSPYSSPPYSPTSMPWGQQGFMGNQWAGSPVAPWPTMPGNMTAWGPAGIAVPNPGGQMEAHSSQPGFMRGGNTPTSPASPTSPTAVMGHPTPLNSLYAPAGETGALQPPPPTSDLLL